MSETSPLSVSLLAISHRSSIITFLLDQMRSMASASCMRSFSAAAADGNCEHLHSVSLCPDGGQGVKSRTSEGGVGKADEWLWGF